MLFRLLSLLLILLALPYEPALAVDRAQVEKQFQQWLVKEIWPEAQATGVRRPTFDAAFSRVSLNWDLPDLVPPGSKAASPRRQRQAEFGAPGRYFNRGSVDGATSMGRRMAKRHATALRQTERRTGVPGRIILAIWGRESGYGQVKIPHNVFEVLGTKGFMSRRADYFRQELIAALQIAEAGHAPEQAMRSSWAGALGQPQFMPSSFLKFAEDGDGDGRADIWRSEADTIASIGGYLAQHGWDKTRDWGFEVSVPASVSCSLEGPDQGLSIREWEARGIRRSSGRAFPAHERDGVAYLMMPAGRNGPAFLVTPNFYVLKDYNKSDLYALFVGHVGDRIQFGVQDFRGAWGRVDSMLRSDVATMQRGLERRGHDVGGADGLAGFKTRRSIGRWQEATGRRATCFPSAALLADLSR
ncbi:lytic murein transglycosylase [Phaeobacter piscinae]|uniref:lytic murein transglycosylase n=1 Tax=Phaeobacter piscinae TaxID=1580596 RepID=UPI000BBE8FD0|nr:lytic murein transglycosylase [Phaeobacter piscinae]ATG41570.1 putative lytic murein transglycosylase [Phaeobacter piscinae]